MNSDWSNQNFDQTPELIKLHTYNGSRVSRHEPLTPEQPRFSRAGVELSEIVAPRSVAQPQFTSHTCKVRTGTTGAQHLLVHGASRL
jgi:hypothetical protein